MYHRDHAAHGQAYLIVDVMPLPGTRTIAIELCSEAALTNDNVRGVIAYSFNNSQFRVHRRHIFDKYDIRGRIDSSNMSEVKTPTKEECEAVRKYIKEIPFRMRTDDDSEITVVYQGIAIRKPDNVTGSFKTPRIYFLPKGHSKLVLLGYEAASANRTILERQEPGSVKDNKNFVIPPAEFTYYTILFSNKSHARSVWEFAGGTGARDCFDSFCETHVKKTG
jgi:hypothetical protein